MRWLLALALLAGCSSDQGFGPVPDPDEDPDEHDPGGWGDWDFGDIPDLAFALGVATLQGGDTPFEVVVVDLRGRVLHRWGPPYEDGRGTPALVALHRGPPGVVYAVVRRTGWPDKTTQDRRPTPPWAPVAPTGDLWRGDLVAGTWTRVIEADVETGGHRIVATGQQIPPVGGSGHALELAPLGLGEHRVLAAPTGWACGTSAVRQVLGLSLDGSAPEQAWPVSHTWPASDPGHVWGVRGGLDADGNPAVLLGVSSSECTNGSPPWARVLRWKPDGRSEVIEELTDPLVRPVLRWQPESGTVLRTEGPERRSWALSGPEGESRGALDGASLLPVGVLDAEHGAFAVVAHQVSGYDELVLIADGQPVWTIDELELGLGSAHFIALDGVVVDVP